MNIKVHFHRTHLWYFTVFLRYKIFQDFSFCADCKQTKTLFEIKMNVILTHLKALNDQELHSNVIKVVSAKIVLMIKPN